MDTQLTHLPQPGMRPFYDRYVEFSDETKPNKITHNDSEFAIFYENNIKPKFKFICEEKIIYCQSVSANKHCASKPFLMKWPILLSISQERNELFCIVVKFLMYVRDHKNGSVDGVSLGRNGINIMCVIDWYIEVDIVFPDLTISQREYKNTSLINWNKKLQVIWNSLSINILPVFFFIDMNALPPQKIGKSLPLSVVTTTRIFELDSNFMTVRNKCWALRRPQRYATQCIHRKAVTVQFVCLYFPLSRHRETFNQKKQHMTVYCFTWKFHAFLTYFDYSSCIFCQFINFIHFVAQLCSFNRCNEWLSPAMRQTYFVQSFRCKHWCFG